MNEPSVWMEIVKQVPALGCLVILMFAVMRGLHRIITNFQTAITEKDKYLEVVNKQTLDIIKDNTMVTGRTLEVLNDLKDHMEKHK